MRIYFNTDIYLIQIENKFLKKSLSKEVIKRVTISFRSNISIIYNDNFISIIINQKKKKQ